MNFFFQNKQINFLRYKKAFSILSICLIVFSFFSFFYKGFSLGLDFTGGGLVEIKTTKTVMLEDVNNQLKLIDVEPTSVQYFGSSTDVVIKISQENKTQNINIITDKIVQNFKLPNNEFEIRRVDFIGPNIGEEFQDSAAVATLIALLVILFYVSMRFEWRLALGSVGALAHDVILTLAIFSLFSFEIDMTVLAAVLAVIGYSLNDTIVVMDRIRENFKKFSKKSTHEIINISLNQTLSRTLVTSITTLLVILSLLFLGGELTFNFALALLFGIIFGTYSSIYVASSIAISLKIDKKSFNKKKVIKEGEDLEALF